MINADQTPCESSATAFIARIKVYTMEKRKNLKKKDIATANVAKEVKAPSKIKSIGALTMLMLGVILMPTGFLLANVIQDKIDEGIADQVAVPDPDSSKFEDWETNDYENAPERYKTVYLWNLTNPDAYLQGATPVYEEIGPFVFRQLNYKYNIKFSDNEDEVSFKEYSTFVQVSGEKVADVNITNINLALLGSIMQAGGSVSQLIELIFPILLSQVKTTFIDELNAVMAELLTEEGITSMLAEAIPDLVNDLLGGLPTWLQDMLDLILDIMDIDLVEIAGILVNALTILIPGDLIVDLMADAMPSAEEIFYEEWANDYFPEVNVDLTPVIQYLQENLDCEDLNLFLEYIREQLEDKPIINFLLMIVEFFTSINFIQKIIDWLLDVLLDWIEGSALQTMLEGFLENMIRDLGAGLVDEQGGPAGKGVDIDGRPPYNFPGAPADLNISTHSQGGSGITLEQSRALWNKSNPDSLNGFDYLENKVWYNALAGDSKSKAFLISEFGLKENQLNMILNWIDVGVHTWVKNAGGWTYNDWNSDLVVTRSVEEWLFTANDTAVYNHQVYYDDDVSKAYVGILDNCHNPAEAEDAEVPSITMKTGRDDVSEVAQIVKYNGADKLYIWAEPIEVEGTDGTQFAPDVTEEETLEVFSQDLMRTVEMEFDEEAEIYGIDLLRFKMADDTFSANPMYYMYTNGLINLASVEKYQNVPVRISKPHFLDGDASLRVSVAGMRPDEDSHDTYIDVEPISGLTMNAHQKAQINLEIGPMDCWYPNITHAAMPIFWMEDSGEIPEDLAEKFKDLVYGALELKEQVPLICLAVGACLAVPGVSLLTSQTEKRRHFKDKGLPRKDKLSPKKDKLLKSQVDDFLERLGIGTQGLKNNGVSELKKPENNGVQKPTGDLK